MNNVNQRARIELTDLFQCVQQMALLCIQLGIAVVGGLAPLLIVPECRLDVHVKVGLVVHWSHAYTGKLSDDQAAGGEIIKRV